jgi:alkanesulfonate monooxygenase SsuD/methylene tetrahydromethanopterin reductase-like flavin-dependent oxidoreductase (luciferase family)
LDRAARVANGWLPLFVTVEQFVRANAELDARLAAVGRLPNAVRRGAVVIMSPDRRAHGRQEALDWMSSLWHLDRDRLGRYLVSGTVEACAGALQQYRDAGAEHVAVLVADDDATRAFARIASAEAASRSW